MKIEVAVKTVDVKPESAPKRKKTDFFKEFDLICFIFCF